MRVKVWGARGSVPSPGPETYRYGGNTSCVQVTLSDGTSLVLDAGTGIRNLGLSGAPDGPRLNILLTHLHMDHIQGLMFFAPLFSQTADIAIWGPAVPGEPLLDRIARYISAPLSPVEVSELPCRLSGQEAPHSEWRIGPASIRAAPVCHRGPTLGYRITEGDTSLCYLPDHEPRLEAATAALAEAEELRAATGLRVEMWDERLTTVSADRDLLALDMKAGARRQVVDKVAAAVMLQAWLDHRRLTPTPDEPLR